MTMNDYPVVTLSEIADISKGKKPSTTSEIQIDETYLPYLLIEAFEGNYPQFTNDATCRKVSENNIEIVWDGERAGLISTGHCGYLGSTLAAVKLKDETTHSKFVFYTLQAGQAKLRGQAEGTGVPHLSRWSVENFLRSISYPCQNKRRSHPSSPLLMR